MTDKEIQNFMLKHGLMPMQRIERNNGGQYLSNFLKEFSAYVRNHTIDEIVGELRKKRN